MSAKPECVPTYELLLSEGSRPQHTVLLADYRRDVQVLVGVDIPDNVANCSFLRIHDEPPGLTVIDGFAKTDCMDRTVT